MTEANNLLELLEAGMRLETHACGPCVGDDNFPDGEPGLSAAKVLGPCVGDDDKSPPPAYSLTYRLSSRQGSTGTGVSA